MSESIDSKARLTSKRDTDRELVERLTVAASAARVATERYVEIRRQCEQTATESRQLRAASQHVREELRNVVSSYVSIMRRDGVPPERVIVMVKQAVDASELAMDIAGRRALMEEVASWAVDAYYAA